MKNILILGSEGYIGSALQNWLRQNYFNVTRSDIFAQDRENSQNYRNLSRQYLALFDAVILLAGHSSVQMCKDNIYESFKNNVDNFIDLLDKLHNNVKFIYISSASVYGNSLKFYEFEEMEELKSSLSEYDFTKQSIDKIIQFYKPNFDWYGLRLGTVNGFSPNMRLDLMINQMVFTAKTEKRIIISSPSNYRAILSVKDLCRSITTILKHEKNNSGYYNLASFNASIGEIGHTVAHLLQVPIVETPGDSIYSFALSTKKFTQTFGPTFYDNIESIVTDLKPLNIKKEDKHKYIRDNKCQYF